MSERTQLTTVETICEQRSWLFTIQDQYGEDDEAIVVPCDDGVSAWINRCTHEAQRLDRGFGVAMRDGEIVCPKHGSMFGTCSGHCENGDAAGTTLPSVDVTVEDGVVYLTDDDVVFSHKGSNEEENEGPSSTSHLSF